MFHNAEIVLGLAGKSLSIAQIPTTEEVAVIFSSPQFFVALSAGILMAFAFQFLLTNLSLAANFSDRDDAIDLDADNEDSWGKKFRQIEGKVGAWALLTVNTALFIACFLAVKLSLVNSITLGAIIGVAIWSGYFLLLVWMSSNAVGSLVGSAVKTASSGAQGVMGIATAAMGAGAANKQIVNTVEASVAAVRKELSSAIDPIGIRNQVEDYLGDLPLPKLDLNAIRGDLERLLGDVDVRSLANSDVLQNVNRQSFVDLVASRTDFSKKDIDRVADILESVWQQSLNRQVKDPQAELVNYIKSANPEDLRSGNLTARLAQAIGGNGQDKKEHSNGVMDKAVQAGVGAAMTAVLERVDLSDADVEKISSQLQQLAGQATDKAQQFGNKVKENLPSLPQSNPMLVDVENYILNSQSWHLNRETIKQEFKEVIHDLEAAPGLVRKQLEQLNRDNFVQFLNQRGDFDDDRVNEIADQFEEIRMEVLNTVQTGESEEQSQDLRSRIENYLRSTGKEELNPEGIERDFTALLEDPDAGFEALRDRLGKFDRNTLVELLGQREDFSQEEAEELIGRLEETRDRVVSQAQETQAQAKSKAQELRQRVESYLRDTNLAELNPDAIAQDFQTLFEDPQAGLKALRERVSQFDRETLVELLKARGDLNEEQINQFVDRIQSVGDHILQAPQQVSEKAKEQYDRLINQIGDYLRNTNLEELDPEGIKQDFAKLFENPKEGAVALRERLSQVDRETLVKLLSQREGLTEDQINQTIDKVQDAINSVVKQPRRLASRAKDKVYDLQASLANYLRNTNKQELNPEGIQRDLQLLFRHPKEGMGNIGDRIKQFDRSSLVSLLSQREDISEEEANQIADRIVAVRDRFVEQVQNVQGKVQSALDGVFDRIRNYLNSLERPELDYEGVKRDFRKLFDDPQAGFDAIKERLSQFDRDTLVAIISSREDISEADANRIIDRIESARDSVMQRAEYLQEQAKRRIEDIKHQAKKQGEEARKAAATAAWWLFGTAVTSVAISALAGAIAVGGLNLFG
ncbi:MFS transporter [Aerosakkonema funiforme]|uniref:MFS transporter n=1 Tax=Aerosakkonema funiforme TaxID=1246630 RepID=UPI0035BA2816